MKINQFKDHARSLSVAGVAIIVGTLTSCSLVHPDSTRQGGVRLLGQLKAEAEYVAAELPKNDKKASKAFNDAKAAVSGTTAAIVTTAKSNAPWLFTRIDISEKAIDSSTKASVKKFLDLEPGKSDKSDKSDSDAERDEIIAKAIEAVAVAIVKVVQTIRFDQAQALSDALNERCEWKSWEELHAK
jgi:hypothetical protein